MPTEFKNFFENEKPAKFFWKNAIVTRSSVGHDAFRRVARWNRLQRMAVDYRELKNLDLKERPRFQAFSSSSVAARVVIARRAAAPSRDYDLRDRGTSKDQGLQCR